MPTPAVPTVDLITAADAQAAMSAAGVSYSGDVQQLVTEVSAQIQQYLSRAIPSQSFSVTLDGIGGKRILLPNTPITAVSSLSVDGVAIPPAANATGSGFVFSQTTVMLRGYDFCRGVQNIALAYTAGFTTVPQDLQRACKEGILAYLSSMTSGDVRANSLKAGDSAVDFGDQTAMASLCLTPNVTSILNQWRRMAPI